MQKNGLIFDIQSFSVHDGPGCRTNVFLMGCPLRCEWCANPEGLENKERLMFRASKCVVRYQLCQKCIGVCPSQAIILSGQPNGLIEIEWHKCNTCNDRVCTFACLKEALVKCGKELSVAELMDILNRDRRFWGRDGGVTFSGGEPLFQGDFLIGALQACRDVYIHTAIETSAFASLELFLQVMKYVDFAFLDIKHMDSHKHREKTGVTNELILSNILALATSDWPGRAVIRMPVIPGFNDTGENIIALIQFMKETGLGEINLLPFHRLGDSKWQQCGMKYPYSDISICGLEMLEHVASLFKRENIVCYIGSDTPF